MGIIVMNEVIYYNENEINEYKKNYKLNPQKFNEIYTNQFKCILSLCESYENNNKKFNSKYKFNTKKNNKNYVRKMPAERPKTFLNTSKGEIDDLNKELNGNLNKLSISNCDKIYKKIIYLIITILLIIYLKNQLCNLHFVHYM